VSLSLRPEHLKRYKDIALLLAKYGRADLIEHAQLDQLLPQDERKAERSSPEGRALADDLERLGPTFIKLGQLLSTRPDIVPGAYADGLKRLQSDCAPLPFAQIEAVLDEELGEKRKHGFRSIDPEPLAAASMAQVHRAVMRDGREVAVKVQRPGIREQVLADLDALGEVAEFLHRNTEAGERYRTGMLFEEFRRSMLRELDFRQEALHLATLGESLREIPEVIVPQPLLPYSTSRVLTMELVRGTKISSVGRLARLELDGERLADALFRAYLKQMLSDGMFHADPHPGNVFIVDGRIALIDLGMVARLAPGLRDALLQLLIAVSENKADEVTRVLLRLATVREDADRVAFERAVSDIIAQHQELAGQRPQVGRAMLLLLTAGAKHGVHLPAEFAMIGKTLLNLDEIGLTLAPHFDPAAAIRRHAARLTEERMRRDFSPGSLFTSALEVKDLLQQMPTRVSRILELLADNNLRLKVDTVDEDELIAGFQKVANRITMGLVLAALIVGAALLMNVDTTFQLFGYPGLAILLFLAAAAGGLALVIVILLYDIKSRRR
jgi:predicted unusual protein kinase regulating ubiquinone biosynthesis (AarF/ABC1/UbiB family)